MPSYEVTDPDTGKTLILTGDSPPTEAELDEIFSSYSQPVTQPEEQKSKPLEQGSILEGVGEAAATIGTGIGSQIAGGWRGLAALASGQGADASADVAKETQEALQYLPKTERGQDYVQAAGDAFEKIGQLAKYFPAKAAAFLSHPLDFDSFQKLDEELRNNPIGEVVGDKTFEATGSPALSTFATVLPEAAMELFPAALAGKAAGGVRNAASNKAGEAVSKAQDAARLQGAGAGDKVTGESIQQTVKAVQKATPEEMAAMIDADPKILTAIDSLGIDAEPVFSQVSKNPQYREVEGGLRAIPGSEINAQANAFSNEVKLKADELIETYGGVKDKALLSEQFREDSLSTLDSMREEISGVYNQIDSNVKKSERAVPQSTVSFLMDKADDLGGVENLEPKLKKLLNDLGESPTIGLIDQRRKDIGEAMRNTAKTFGDQESGTLKALYGRLTDDMNDILDEKGFKELSQQGKAMVVKQKNIEQNMQDLLGKKLSKDLSSVVGTATKGLAQGRTKQFVDTINKIPKEYRQKAVVTSLNDVFRGKGQGMEAFNSNDYLKFWNELQRNPRARTALFKELPRGSRGALTGLADIAKGINQADRNVIRTGVIQAFFEPNSGLVSKMLGGAGRALAASKAGPAGSAMYSAVTDMLSQSTSPAQRTAALIATPNFQSVVKGAINEGLKNPSAASAKLKKANDSLTKTKKYQDWVNTLPEADKIAATTGFLTFLTSAGAKDGERDNN